MKPFTDSLLWRYAVKQYDTTRKLTDEEVDYLLEAARLAPTSIGLQPFKIFVIENPEIRSRLREAAYGQPQVTDASHLFVFAVPTDLGDSHVDEYMNRTSEQRNVPLENLAAFRGMVQGNISAHPEGNQRVDWAGKQAYIGLGLMIAAAAAARIDFGAMEGFDPVAFDEILGLKEKGYTVQVIAGAGYRLDSDPAAALPKVRKPKNEFSEIIA